MSSKSVSVSNPHKLIEAIEVGLDPMALIRAAQIVPASAIPMAPDRIQFLELSTKQGLLKVAGDQHAETIAAMKELAGKQAELREDAGRYAPDPKWAAAVHTRLEGLRDAKVRTTALLAYLEELQDVALHDAMTIILKTKKELLHAGDHDPRVLDRYPAVMAIVEQRKDAVLLGRARKAAEEKAKAEAADKARANGNGNGNGGETSPPPKPPEPVAQPE